MHWIIANEISRVTLEIKLPETLQFIRIAARTLT